MAALALAACDRSVGVPKGAPPAPRGASGDAAPEAPSAPAPAPTPPEPAARAAPAALPDRAPSDSEITARAAAAMRRDPALAGADLSVQTNHGVVSVTGTVSSPEQMAVAEARAESTSGVMRVETHVSVDPERRGR